MITKQMEGEAVPGRGTRGKGTEVGTQGYSGSPGWLTYGAGGDLPGGQCGPGREGLQHLTEEAELDSEGCGEPRARARRALGVLRVGTIHISGWIILCCGGCPVYHRIFSSILASTPREASNTTLPPEL